MSDERDEGSMSITGYDLSAPLNYQALAATSPAFVYHQATDGVGSPNRFIVGACNTLRSLGITDLGAYLYARIRHGRPQDADEQVKEYLDLRANAGASLPILFDIEGGDPKRDSRANLLATPDEVRAGVLLALESFDRFAPGETVWAYTDKGDADALHLGNVPELKALPLLISAFLVPVGQDAPEPTVLPHIPAPWTVDDVIGHQWVGDVPMFGGRIDRIRLLMTVDQLRSA